MMGSAMLVVGVACSGSDRQTGTGGDPTGGVGPGGASQGGTSNAGGGGQVEELFQAPECSMPFPALACDGAPVGSWELVSMCEPLFPDACPDDAVITTGEISGTLTFDENGTVYLVINQNTSQAIVLPASCLDTTCEAIDCDKSSNPEQCACKRDSGGGSTTMETYMVQQDGTVTFPGVDPNDNDTIFCPGGDRADLQEDGLRERRTVWQRVR